MWENKEMLLSVFYELREKYHKIKFSFVKAFNTNLTTFDMLYRVKIFKLIDCMVLNAVFNIISVLSWQSEHLSILSFNLYAAQYSFQATGCFLT